MIKIELSNISGSNFKCFFFPHIELQSAVMGLGTAVTNFHKDK